MSPWSQIIREIAFRKWNALLMFTGLAAVAATISMGKLIAEADERETRRVTRDMGFNLRIIPAETDLGQFYRDGYSRRMMDASMLDRLAISLTKSWERFHRGTLGEVLAALESDPDDVIGEMTLVVAGAEPAEEEDPRAWAVIDALAEAGVAPSVIRDALSGPLGLRRREVYQRALKAVSG